MYPSMCYKYVTSVQLQAGHIPGHSVPKCSKPYYHTPSAQQQADADPIMVPHSLTAVRAAAAVQLPAMAYVHWPTGC